MKKLLHISFQAVFWGWNLVFLMVVYLGILPIVGIPLVMATLSGTVPVDFFLSLVALIAIPTFSTIIGFQYRQHPLDLFRLFYGVEAPLFLLCLLRLFVFRELTPASTHILISVGVAILAFASELFYGYVERQRTLAWLQMLAHSLMLLVGAYAGIVMLFYAAPVGVWTIEEFFKFQWLVGFWYAFIYNPMSALFGWLLATLLFFMTCSLFVVMPSVLTALYTFSGLRILRGFAVEYGKKYTLAGMLGVAIASLTLFISFQQQPQVQAFSLLANPPQSQTARQAVLTKSDIIRSGLVNAYLSNYRYLSSRKDNNHIEFIYQEIFGLPKWLNKGLQNTYNHLMSPFLYQGNNSDIDKAEKLYAEFFDTSIQKAESSAINHALESTSNQDEAKAGLLNLNQRKVFLRQQEITVKEHGDWADVQLYEVYDNKTNDVQEVFYSFSLPESAVITGLWLGDTPNLSKRFPFVVSPRGAAQKVYNRQVQRARPVDPALLEQVGPRHYRLRAFPIPIKNQRNGPTEMNLWLTYQVMRQEQGWALPQLGEKRNIYWTDKTKHIRNGKVSNEVDDWTERYIPASQPSKATTQQASVEGYTITGKPLTQKDYSLPQNQKFAIVLDGSLSMNRHINDLEKTLTWLKKHGFANNNLVDNDADLFIT
jgi:putative PEP-CTERM system integral membrane protein